MILYYIESENFKVLAKKMQLQRISFYTQIFGEWQFKLQTLIEKVIIKMRPFEEIKLFIKEAFIEVKEKLFYVEEGLKKVETRLDSIEKNDQKVKESQKENKNLRKSLHMIEQDFKKVQIISRKVIRKTKKNLKEIETIKNQQENRLKNLPPPRPRIIRNDQLQVLEKVVQNDSDPDIENTSDSSSEECAAFRFQLIPY